MFSIATDPEKVQQQLCLQTKQHLSSIPLIIISLVASSNTYCLEAHSGIYRLLMNWILNTYVIVNFWQKVDFLISNAR